MKKQNETEIFREKEWYRERIIEMVRKIESKSVILSVYSYIMGLLSDKRE